MTQGVRRLAAAIGLRWLATAIVLAIAIPALAQEPPSPPPEPQPTHDISKVDPAPLGGAIAVPLPEKQRRQMKKYEIPDLAGAKQAIGSQLIDGRLPRPLLDYFVSTTAVDQRISLFEGGLVVVRMTGAGGTIHKRVIIPADALEHYLDAAAADRLKTVRPQDVSAPTDRRTAFLRIYDKEGKFVERVFDPAGARPKVLQDQTGPLADLLRAVSEDRTVTSTLANYAPKVGDELVGDDRKVYRVARIIDDSGVVELRCLSQPTILYVAIKDLYNYFVGRTAQ